MVNNPNSNVTNGASGGNPKGPHFKSVTENTIKRGLPTDVRVVETELFFLPVETRVPLKFGSETLTSVTCARAKVTVADRSGRTATGWGETPLNVQWVWPSSTAYSVRHDLIRDFCTRISAKLAKFDFYGHPLEIGHAFQESVLNSELATSHEGLPEDQHIPLLAGLLCCSPFDIAVYDAYGKLHNLPVFETLTKEFLGKDLSYFIEPVEDTGIDYTNQYPQDYLRKSKQESMLAWHLVGGLDPLSADEVPEDAPLDDHPLILHDWIERDGLQCLKIKLRGNDQQHDYDRIVHVGHIAAAGGVKHLTADFNCTVEDPKYVVEILDKLAAKEPQIFDAILYIEQPFPYDIENNLIDVHEVSRRKPLLMDESAHNWKLVRLGRSLGWNGVALKTCKTLSGALLSLCWAKSHGMHLMVQDLTNPMLAQIPHLSLAAHIDTLLGVETNGMQFYPSASDIESEVHPGIYQRRNGSVNLSTIQGPGFGYRIDEMNRSLPAPVAKYHSQRSLDYERPSV